MNTKKDELFKQLNKELTNSGIPMCKEQIEKQIHMNVVVRRYATKGFSRTYGVDDREKLMCPVIEYYYINEKLKRPLLNESHIIALNIASAYELEMINEYSYDIFDILTLYFSERGYILAALKMIYVRADDSITVKIQEIKDEDCLLWKKEKA